MLIALAGSVLLLISTYLVHITVPGEFGSYSLWDAIKITGNSSTDASIPLAIGIAFNASYFAFRARRLPLPSKLSKRAWSSVAVVVNLLVAAQLLGLSHGLVAEADQFTRGVGYYTTYFAGICMLLGSIVGVFGRHPSSQAQTTEKATSTPPPPPPDPPAAADRLRQLKSLLDDGLITQDEYDTRRSRILDDI